MRKIIFFLSFVLSGFTSVAQQEFFVYLQSDNEQPFYARINTTIYSSTENGYMIIPKLGDNSYEIIIGFPKNIYPELRFTVEIRKKDNGFQVKNLGEKGWALVNLQNNATIMQHSLPSLPVSEIVGIRKTDAFSEMLASVVNDSAVLYTIISKKNTDTSLVKKVATEAEANKDVSKDTTNSVQAITQTAIKDTVYKRDTLSTTGVGTPAINPTQASQHPKADSNSSGSLSNLIRSGNNNIDSVSNNKELSEKPFITRIAESATKEVYQATYLEQYNYNTDTIKITIPLIEINDSGRIAENRMSNEKNDIANAKEKSANEEKMPLPKPVVVDTVASVRGSLQIINSDCKAFASDYDIDKLRVKMLQVTTIDDKLAAARKYFKTKCLSVKQVKALTELFPTDETKLRFYDTSYAFVSDTANFHLLAELLENDEYKNRFKAMIHK